jgi:transcriptional regulator with XRE-family HTH domain
MSWLKALQKSFSLALNKALLARYREIPSASFLAREFNLRASHCEPITQETARRWLKGLAIPTFDKLLLLRSWLDLDLNALGQPNLKATTKKNQVEKDLLAQQEAFVARTQSIKESLKILMEEVESLEKVLDKMAA